MALPRSALLTFLDRPASPDPNGKLLAQLIDHRSHVNSIEMLSCVVHSNPWLALMPELIVSHYYWRSGQLAFAH